VTPYLTCYGKQRRHFEFTAIWRTLVLCLNFIILKLLLLSRDVNSPRLCYVNNEVHSVTPYLTSYGKQRRHFEFLTIWRIRAVCLNLTLTCYGCWM